MISPIDPAVDLVAEFMDAEENQWWIRPLKAVLYVAPFIGIAVYFFFM
ncbi:MAG: hypothetical protein L7S56_03530 [Candidatus Poseidonia sp.]|nr:hypothetical protein [Poseidonia sp.]